MSSLDKLPNNFHAAGTNGRLDLSLPSCVSCCPTNCLCSTWSGSWIARFVKKSVAPNRRSSADWIPARTGKFSVGVGRQHPVTMRKASLRMLSMRRVCVSTQRWSRPRKEQRCKMSWHLHLIQIPQVSSTAHLGRRVSCAKPRDGDRV